MKMPHWNTDLLQKAWHFATIAHADQMYGGAQEDQKITYINHIGSVAFEVMGALQHHHAINADLAISCALLHDILEDTAVTPQILAGHFGEEVLAGVEALTKNETLIGKSAQMLDSLSRIKQQPKEIWMVKLADRIVNLTEPPYYWNREKREAYRQEGQQIYDALHEASEYLAQRLAQRIEQYQKFIKE